MRYAMRRALQGSQCWATNIYHHPITSSIVPSEECLQLDGRLIWGPSMKIYKIWPGGPPVPEMTLNDFIIIKNARSTT